MNAASRVERLAAFVMPTIRPGADATAEQLVADLQEQIDAYRDLSTLLTRR